MVGPTGFEPATSTAPWWRATGLRYGPTREKFSLQQWGDRRDLNPRQPEPQSGALPTELRPP